MQVSLGSNHDSRGPVNRNHSTQEAIQWPKQEGDAHAGHRSNDIEAGAIAAWKIGENPRCLADRSQDFVTSGHLIAVFGGTGRTAEPRRDRLPKARQRLVPPNGSIPAPVPWPLDPAL